MEEAGSVGTRTVHGGVGRGLTGTDRLGPMREVSPEVPGRHRPPSSSQVPRVGARRVGPFQNHHLQTTYWSGGGGCVVPRPP